MRLPVRLAFSLVFLLLTHSFIHFFLHAATLIVPRLPFPSSSSLLSVRSAVRVFHLHFSHSFIDSLLSPIHPLTHSRLSSRRFTRLIFPASPFLKLSLLLLFVCLFGFPRYHVFHSLAHSFTHATVYTCLSLQLPITHSACLFVCPSAFSHLHFFSLIHTHSLIHAFPHVSLFCPLHSLTHFLVHSLMLFFLHPLYASFTFAFIPSLRFSSFFLVHVRLSCFPCVYSLHSLSHSLTHSFTHLSLPS